ncbi:hypothetical protein PMAYCL1PPCAC_10789, partial [Pristionchus mayeri]
TAKMLILLLVVLAAAPARAAYTAPGVDWVEVTRQVREAYADARWLNATHLVRMLADRADELNVDVEELATNFRVFLSLVILSPGERRALAHEMHRSGRAGGNSSNLLAESITNTEELLSHLSANFPNHYAVLKRRLDVVTPIVEKKLGKEAREFVKTFGTKYALSIIRALLSPASDDGQAARKTLNEEFATAYGSLGAACRKELEHAFPLATLRAVAGEAAGL